MPNPLPNTLQNWFHAVSVGELHMLRPLLNMFTPEQQRQICVTTTTPNGWNTLSSWDLPIHKAYLPFDIPFSLKRFIGDTQPNLFLVEGEIWFELIFQVKKKGGRVAVINGRFKRSDGILLKKSLKSMSCFWVRGAGDEKNLRKMGIDSARISITGNLKFDLNPPGQLNGSLKDWCEAGPLICIGSVAEDEIDLAQQWVDALQLVAPQKRIIYAPRQIQNAGRHLPNRREADRQYRSKNEFQESTNLLILDSMGELASTYRFADFAIVAGGFGQRGGQNFIEALAAGCPVICGPNMKNFLSETQQAKEAGVLWELQHPNELAEIVRQIESNPQLSGQCKSFVQDHRGALARTYQGLVDFDLESPTRL